MKQSPSDVLSLVFGHRSFRGNQQQVVEHVTDGGDALVLMPTGGGKSLCFQIPSLCRGGIGVIISPLLALMADQVSALQRRGVRAEMLTATSTPDDRRRIGAQAAAGTLDFLYMSPEKFIQERTIDYLRQYPLSLVAVDEAHCVSEWGHDFRPDYLEIGRALRSLPRVPVMAVTATATPKVEEDIVAMLGIPGARRFRASFDRPNITILVAEAGPASSEAFATFVKERMGTAGIVYRNKRKDVERTAEAIRNIGGDPIVFHAKLPQEEKDLALRRFETETSPVVVATMAFGMGMDRADIRWVAHLDIPRSLANWYQEIGRGGRDGAPAMAWLSYRPSDFAKDLYLARNGVPKEGESPPTPFQVERRVSELRAVSRFLSSPGCRRQALLAHFGEQAPSSCEGCDRCLNPVASRDVTAEALLLIKAARETRFRYGAQGLARHLIGLGQSEEDPRNVEEAMQPSFGEGRGVLEDYQWESLARRMLLAEAFSTSPEPDAHGFVLGDLGRELLSGRATLDAVLPVTPLRAFRNSAKVTRPAHAMTPELKRLYTALQGFRSQASEEKGVPAGEVFSNVTLDWIVQERPGTPDALSRAPGLGAVKMRLYGGDILSLVERHAPKDPAPTRMTIPSFSAFRKPPA